MRIQWNRRYTTIALYALLVLVGAIAFASVLNNLTAFGNIMSMILAPITPIAYGIAIAFLVNPLVRVFEERLLPRIDGGRIGRRGRRAIGMILGYLVALVFVVGIFAVIIPGMIDNIQGVVSKSGEYIELAEALANRLTEELPDNLAVEINNFVLGFTEDIVSQARQFITSSLATLFSYTMAVTGFVLNFVMGLAVSVYLLSDKERFFASMKKVTLALFSEKNAHWLMELGRYTNKMFNGFIIGKIVDSTIIAILCFIGCTLLGFKSAMLISIITGIFNMIPYFGPIIGAVPCFFIIVVDSPVQSIIWIVFIFALQQLDGNVIGPLVLGESIGMSSFWVIVAITIFGSFFGILGMFVGVPIFAVIFWAVSQFIDSRLAKKNLSTDADDYLSPESELIK